MSVYQSLRPLFLLLLATMACGPISGGIIIPTPTSLPSPTALPPAATPPPSGGLPAPLYFLNAPDAQIWRIERDATTLTQITHEPAPVTYFDVSSAAGDVAYVSNNDLVRADAAGGQRTVLVDGADLPVDNFDARINIEIKKPRWSPDGTQLAFGLGGVNLIPAGGGQPQLLQPSDQVPTLNPNSPPHPQARFYNPGPWSPDGTRLLIEFGDWPEGGGWLVRSMAEGTSVELVSDQGSVCCNPTWSVDSQSVYLADFPFGDWTSGLWRAEAASGTTQVLVASGKAAPFNLFSMPHQAPDGQLYVFNGPGEIDPSYGELKWPSLLTLSRSGADGAGLAPLRTDAYGIFEALWAVDGSGAVIAEFTPGNLTQDYPLTWIDSVNGPAVRLPAKGSNLRWGK